MGKLLGASTFVSQKRVCDQGLTESNSTISGRNLAVPQHPVFIQQFFAHTRCQTGILENTTRQSHRNVAKTCQKLLRDLYRGRHERVVKAPGNVA
jgi:hypothetical protein